ncbi:MAG: hypothetical protein ACP5N3_06225 [Candidatus Nanoarchaeia archaeon]
MENLKDFRYVKELTRSMGEIFKRPILLLPFVYIFVLNTIFLFITPEMPIYGPEDIIDYGLVAWILGLGLIQLIVSVVFNAMSLASFRMYVAKEEITAGNQAFQGARMYWKLLLLRIYQLMIILVPLVILFAIYLAVTVLSPTLGVIVGIILLILYTVYVIMMILFFMFSNAIIAYDGMSAGDSLIESHKYFKSNSPHVFFTLITLLVYLLLFGLIVILIMIPFSLSPQTTALKIWESIILSIISIPVIAAATLYLFKAYNADSTLMAPGIKTAKKVHASPVKKAVKTKK